MSCLHTLRAQHMGSTCRTAEITLYGSAFNWSLELHQQANKRLHRQGQTQKVIVHHLSVEGGRDEDVTAALADKGATQDHLIESLKARIEKVRETA